MSEAEVVELAVSGAPALDELVAAKAGARVSVVLPALDEEATVGAVVRSIRPLLGGLVDELVVVDSGSTDGTAEAAAEAGARVVHGAQVLPGIPLRPGKGEVLWRGLAATSGELVVYVDSDLVDPDPAYVPRLLAPLLADPAVQLVKARYRRPLHAAGASEQDAHDGGGRVTELCARPLLAALAPELADVRQPLAGEYAGRRALLESLPYAAGYGVEIGLLLDTWRRHGRSAIAEADLGVRVHRHRPLAALAQTSREVLDVLLDRCGVPVPAPGAGRPADRPPLRELRSGAATGVTD